MEEQEQKYKLQDLWPKDQKKLKDIKLIDMEFTDMWFLKLMSESEGVVEVCNNNDIIEEGALLLVSTGQEFYCVFHNGWKVYKIKKVTVKHARDILKRIHRNIELGIKGKFG